MKQKCPQIAGIFIGEDEGVLYSHSIVAGGLPLTS